MQYECTKLCNQVLPVNIEAVTKDFVHGKPICIPLAVERKLKGGGGGCVWTAGHASIGPSLVSCMQIWNIRGT